MQEKCLLLHCLSHGKNVGHKSDAFLIEYGEKLILVDGGLSGSAVLDDLLEIRKKRIDKKRENEDYRLHLSLILTHFHRDHILCAVEDIIPCPLIHIDEVFIGPDPDTDPYYNNENTDWDEILRPLFAQTLKKYYPDLEPTIIPFGKGIYPVFFEGDASVEILAPVGDPGKGERFEAVLAHYRDKRSRFIAISVTNSSSLWIFIKKGKRRFLLVGDCTKRSEELYETFDEMKDAYGGYIGRPDVLKYTHHGVNRDAAAKAHAAFKPDYLILTSEESTVPAAMDERCPDFKGKLVNCGLEDVTFETDGNELNLI